MNNNEISIVARRMTEMRESLKILRTDAARYVKVAYSQMQRYESGLYDPPTYVVAGLATMYNCTTDYLLGVTDDPRRFVQEGGIPEDEKNLLIRYRQHNVPEAMRIILSNLDNGDPNWSEDEENLGDNSQSGLNLSGDQIHPAAVASHQKMINGLSFSPGQASVGSEHTQKLSRKRG